MAVFPRCVPLRLGWRPKPFNHAEWVFELKYDGVRALVQISDDKVELISRRGHIYKAWAPLRERLARALTGHRAVLDGELVCLDSDGRPRFQDLLRRRKAPVFVAFDLLFLDGEDLREFPLVERKAFLHRLVPSDSFSLVYAQHVACYGRALFDQACALDLEGIVAKLANAPYRQTNPPPWMQIDNPHYSQARSPS